MTPLEGLLVLGAALGFAGLDLLRKLLARHLRLVPLLFWLTAGVLPLYVGWWLAAGATRPEPGYWLPALASVALNVLANLLYLRAVHLGELSRTIPLLSLTPVFTALLSVPLLGEVPGREQTVGILLVVVGGLLLQRGAPTGDAAGVVSPLVPPSAWLMLGVAVLWSTTTPLDKLSVQAADVPFHAMLLHIGIAVSLLVWLLLAGEPRALREASRAPWLLLAAVAVSAVALGSQLMALERIFAALLETLKRGGGGVAALLLGRLFFGEELTLAKATAVAIMVLGVALLV